MIYLKVVVGTLFVVAIAVFFALFAVQIAYGQAGVEIPLDQVHRGEDGDVFLEAEITATNEIGWTCGAILERRNNVSIHAEDGHPDHGTNLIIESGANSVTFFNIESEAFDEAVKAFVIDGDIKVYTQIGEDGVSSMGFLLEFECNPPTTTTTSTIPTEPPLTTTTIANGTTTTTSVPPVTTTTTEPPPINGVDTGGGALQHLVAVDPTPSGSNLGAFTVIMLSIAVIALAGAAMIRR